ncbi:MAG: hypothetical protein AAGA67_07385 [Cyanobacteria bacterium P01_F01_bin.153]
MILDPYTPAFIIGVMVTCVIVVGLIGLVFGLLGLVASRSAFRLGIYGSYTGAIPGGIIGYLLSVNSTLPLAGFIYAAGGGAVGASVGAIAGVIWSLIGQRVRSRIRRRLQREHAVPSVGEPPAPISTHWEAGGADEGVVEARDLNPSSGSDLQDS